MRTISLLTILTLAGASLAQDMRLAQVLIAGESWRELKLPDSKPGALTADAAGNLFVAESDGKRIWKVDKGGEASLFTTASRTVGRMCMSGDGKLIAALPGEKRLVAFDRKGGESVVAEKLIADDVAVAPSGKVVALDVAQKAVVLVGQAEPLATGIAESGGLAFWKDGGTLVVGDAGGTELFAFRVKQSGGLDAKESYYSLRVRPKQASKVSAIVLDEARRLYAATAEGVQVFDPTGRMSGVLNSPDRQPVTALAFAGEGRGQLTIVCAGKLWTRKTKTKAAWPPSK